MLPVILPCTPEQLGTIPRFVVDLAEAFESRGYKLFLVGGSVRDMCMGVQPKDFDLATDALPDQVVEIAEELTLPHKAVGKAFGIVIVQDDDGVDFEIATFREDIGSGRRPSGVKYTSIDIDVQRRDLTINALFIDVAKGHIVDYVGGLEDIRTRTIRTVGDPIERFKEDPLRPMRAVRFAARFGVELEFNTAVAIMRDPCLYGVSPERILDEFLRGIETARSTSHYIELVDRLGLLEESVFPRLHVWNSARVENKNPVVVVASLLCRNPIPKVQDRLVELKWPKHLITDIVFLMRLSKMLVPRNVYRLYREWAKSSVSTHDILVFAQAYMPMWRSPYLDTFINRYTPKWSGATLLDEGYSGKELGEELQRRETEYFHSLMIA